MLNYVRNLLLYVVFHKPVVLVTGAIVLTTIGVFASVGTSILIGRRRASRAHTTGDARLAMVLLLFCLGDWGLLWALPHLRLSFSRHIGLALAASLGIRLAVFWGLMLARMLTRWRSRQRGVEIEARSAAIMFAVVNLAFGIVQVDAYVVEPLLVETTELSFTSEKLDPTAPPVRVMHLTDLHIERTSYREAAIVRKVNALQPDIIVITGDHLNTSYISDPTAAADLRELFAQLRAPYGIYAVRGTVEPTEASMAWLVEGTDVVWLEQESITLDVRGQHVTLVGAACSHRLSTDVPRLDRALVGIPRETFTLLLYHSPDLIHEAADRGIDLYVAGHTHGGQLRLPFYGALFTSSIYGKQYEAGLFEEDGMTMIISRGIGFEGGPMPRARFLCRPEIVSIELRGDR